MAIHIVKHIIDAILKAAADKAIDDRSRFAPKSAYGGDPLKKAMTRIEHEVTVPKKGVTHAIGTRPKTGLAARRAPGPKN